MVTKMSDLENKFREAVSKAREEFREAQKKADQAVADLEAVAEKYGVPVYANVSPLSQKFEPDGFEKWRSKFEAAGEEDLFEELCDELDVSGNEYGAGWAHSAVCY